jgi:hypothetical protein
MLVVIVVVFLMNFGLEQPLKLTVSNTVWVEHEAPDTGNIQARHWTLF